MGDECGKRGSTRWFYTGNEVGDFNHTGDFNFASGGPDGSGIAAGALIPVFFPPPTSRDAWLQAGAELNQQLLDAAFPFIQLNWVMDIILKDSVFRVSDQNIYVEDDEGLPRFYEARVLKAPTISVTVGEWLNPNFEIGDMSVELNNRDGFFNPYLPQGSNATQWIGARVEIRVGFGQKASNYTKLFTGFVAPKQGVTSNDTTVKLKVYDKFDEDEVPIPSVFFNTTDFPELQDGIEGKALPLIYGDWTVEVGDFGEIPAFCVNAYEENATEFIFKVSQNALASLEQLFLHRGDRTSETVDGPLEVDLDQVTIDLDAGEFRIPAGVELLSDYATVLGNQSAGAGSGLNLVTVASASVNFVQKGVAAGDEVILFTPLKATATLGELKFETKAGGEAGNLLTIRYQASGYTVISDPAFPSEPWRKTLQWDEPVHYEISGNDITIVFHPPVDVTEFPPGDDPQNHHFPGTKYSELNTAINDAVSNTKIKSSVDGDSSLEVTVLGPVNFSGAQDAPLVGTVLAVSSTALSVSGNILFTQGANYSVRTKQFHYVKGDKFTVKCKGKATNVLSVTRLAQAGLKDSTPTGLSVDLDGNFWFCDNVAQKIYQVSQSNVILHTIDYADLNQGFPGAPAVDSISGFSIQEDGTLWFFVPSVSGIYRYDVAADALALYFPTTYVSGLARTVPSGVGLTINSGNLLTLCENSTGDFLVINPFASVQPALTASFNRSAFDAGATEVYDLSADSNAGNLCVIDQQTGKFYRIHPTTGALVSAVVLASTVSSDITLCVGVSTHRDGTVFLLNRADLSVYNYNEFSDVENNPGFIARDIIQSLAGKVSSDFHLNWNQTCREDLSQYKARVYVSEKTKAITFVSKFLQQFNTTLSIRNGAYTLFYMGFDNLRSDGNLIREADIRDTSFSAAKEYTQYFNVGTCDYKKLPFSGKTTSSDQYISVAGVAAAGNEVARKLTMDSVYRRADVDKLMPLFVRLSVPEPEMVTMDVGFRLLFAQISDFYRISFDEELNPITGQKKGGRRFNNVPAFVRSIQYNLDNMTLKLKLWSLGTTKFGDYVPAGEVVGGEGDKIVLTSLGTQGYMAPVGTITALGSDYADIAVVAGENAEDRTAAVVGKAWEPGYVVAFVDASTFETVAYRQIESVSGNRITFTEDLPGGLSISSQNAAGFTTSGHLIRYAEYESASQLQRDNYAFFCPPSVGYPTSSSQESEEQRSGKHSLPDGRIPYVLFPQDYVPS